MQRSSSSPGSGTPARRFATPYAVVRRLTGSGVLLAVLLASALTAGSGRARIAHAEPRAAISPARLVIAEPIRTGSGRDLPPLTITNDGSTSARFRLVILSVDDGQSRPLEPSWLGPALDPFDLAAGTSRTVTLHLTVPADAVGGVYQGLLAVRIEGAPLTTGSVATVLQFAAAVSQGDSPLQQLGQSIASRALPLGALALAVALAGGAYALRARMRRPQFNAGVTVRRPPTLVADPLAAASAEMDEFSANVTVNPDRGGYADPVQPGDADSAPAYAPAPSTSPSAQPPRPLPPLPSLSDPSPASPSYTATTPAMRQPTVPPVPAPIYREVSLQDVLETAPGGVAGAIATAAGILVLIVVLTAASTWWAAMRFGAADADRLTRVEERLAALAADPSLLTTVVPTPRAQASAFPTVAASPSPSASPTPSRTPTPTPSRSATPAPTATRTATPAPTPTATPGRTFPATLFGKPVVTNGRDLWSCADFQSWEQAQMVYEANLPGDPNLIDIDRNGIACEALRAR